MYTDRGPFAALEAETIFEMCYVVITEFDMIEIDWEKVSRGCGCFCQSCAGFLNVTNEFLISRQ